MESWKKIIKNYRLSLFFAISFFTLGLMIILVFFNFYGMGSEGRIVIYDDALREISILGTPADLYKIIVFAGVILITNLILGRELMPKEPYLAYLLGVAALLFTTLIFIVIVDTILIN
ncbi:MAG: hypothetical protein HYT12_04085 [Candidatus Liptonbacteria bacterium]|nr:hypothetical protein [Candidatus Liptonbacteria bacterium]